MRSTTLKPQLEVVAGCLPIRGGGSDFSSITHILNRDTQRKHPIGPPTGRHFIQCSHHRVEQGHQSPVQLDGVRHLY